MCALEQKFENFIFVHLVWYF